MSIYIYIFFMALFVVSNGTWWCTNASNGKILDAVRGPYPGICPLWPVLLINCMHCCCCSPLLWSWSASGPSLSTTRGVIQRTPKTTRCMYAPVIMFIMMISINKIDALILTCLGRGDQYCPFLPSWKFVSVMMLMLIMIITINKLFEQVLGSHLFLSQGRHSTPPTFMIQVCIFILRIMHYMVTNWYISLKKDNIYFS